MSKKDVIDRLKAALNDARNNEIKHIAFVDEVEDSFTTSMCCNGSDLYDYLYSLCERDEMFFEVMYSMVENILQERMGTDDSGEFKPN